MRFEAPRLGGSFAVWGGLFSAFDCTLVAVRKKARLRFAVRRTLCGPHARSATASRAGLTRPPARRRTPGTPFALARSLAAFCRCDLPLLALTALSVCFLPFSHASPVHRSCATGSPLQAALPHLAACCWLASKA